MDDTLDVTAQKAHCRKDRERTCLVPQIYIRHSSECVNDEREVHLCLKRFLCILKIYHKSKSVLKPLDHWGGGDSGCGCQNFSEADLALLANRQKCPVMKTCTHTWCSNKQFFFFFTLNKNQPVFPLQSDVDCVSVNRTVHLLTLWETEFRFY